MNDIVLETQNGKILASSREIAENLLKIMTKFAEISEIY